MTRFSLSFSLSLSNMQSRPTLFSTETWDTSFHPYLALLVRNRTAAVKGTGPSISPSHSRTHSLRSALHASDPTGPAIPRAIDALGLTHAGMTGHASNLPLFFVNIQTDGPVTTDLYQHRLFLDDSQGNAWQTITIPFDSFVLTNTGVVAEDQISMMREKILTVGISALIEPPLLPDSQDVVEEEPASPATQGPSALRRTSSLPGSHGTSVRGSKRDITVQFDLDIAGIWAVASPVDATNLL